MTLTEEQRTALGQAESFIRSDQPGYWLMHGLAGCGKTTVLAELAKRNSSCQLCAPTGKAAAVLRRKTGLDTGTIHSAFYKVAHVSMPDDEDEAAEEIRFSEKYKDGEVNGTMLIDEASMVPAVMAEYLMRAGMRIIASGDPGQLPPVKGAQYFTSPNATLQHIHRQAADSPIIRQAHSVRSGQRYEGDGKFRVQVGGRIGEAALAADMVLCWKNTTKAKIMQDMRNAKGYGLFTFPRAGEPVVCLKNCAEYNVWNGATYTLAANFRPGDACIVLRIDGREVEIPDVYFRDVGRSRPTTRKRGGVQKLNTRFDFAYALTVHKAQGSEWGNVLLIDEYDTRQHRNAWVYTGITRAADGITVYRRR